VQGADLVADGAVAAGKGLEGLRAGNGRGLRGG